jgi:ADP-heptose:LPS heptosyltransferase
VRIVVLHAGGFGDLVLLESLFSELRAQHPDASLELACRTEVAAVAGLYAPALDAVHAFEFSPYRWALPDDHAALQARSLLQRLAGAPVDLLVSAELRATWLSEILAAGLAPRETLLGDHREPPPSDILILLGKLGLERNADVRRLPPADAEHELDRLARLAGAAARRIPSLRPLPTQPAAELVVFPLSATPTNYWPIDRMGAAAQRIAAAHGTTIALVGSHQNRPEFERAVAAGFFGPTPAIVTGGPDEIPAIATRVAGARGFLGIDTGLVHLSQAYGVPGAVVSGGGHWPAYGAWTARSAVAVAPIPCFGCNWDCAFERPFCTEGIGVDDVVAAFDAALSNRSGVPLVHPVDAYTPREREMLGAAGAVHRAAQKDRASRLTAITRLRNLIARYAWRTRKRSRKAESLLESLAETTVCAARQLEEAAPGR